jgi:hypothetical protein
MKLKGEPLLVIGLRDEKRRIEGYRINLDTDVHPDLVRVAGDALAYLDTLKPVDYSPYVDPEADEYLSLATEKLRVIVTRPAEGKKADKGDGAADEEVVSEKDEAARIVALVRDSDVLPELGAAKLIERLGSEFYLQAICLKSGEDRIGFLTKARKQQVMKRSIIPLGKSDDNDRLKKISLPELLLESDVHAIVSPEEIAILNRTQFQFMVSDTKLVFDHVPLQVKRIAAAFETRGVTLAPGTQAALLGRAVGSISLAKRLDAFAERIGDLDVALIENGKGFTDQELKAADFVNAKGEVACGPGRLGELLDALEGRYFGDAFSTEKRRADRFRPRA